MGQSLEEIAQKLKSTDKKVQLIYAFNGTGKTRLSREFKELVAPKNIEGDEDAEDEQGIKVLYYNAFTEDLFYWDNDLDADVNRKLIIRPNGFTDLVLQVLREQGLDGNIISNFQHYTSNKLTPRFNEDYSEITFSMERGNDELIENIKISKGEESNLIWCVFYSLLEQVVEVLNIPELENRPTNTFNDLQFVLIDDPVSSLDENHLIELAVNLAELIKKTSNLKFVISTHNPLFYNVLYNELGNKVCYMLNKFEDGTYELVEKKGDSNKSFSYHHFLKQTIQEAVDTNSIEKYHFTLLRNLYEKTANFLGYPQWSELLPDDKQTYYNRVIQFTSHSTLSNEVVAEPTEPEKQIVKFLLKHLVDSKYWQEKIEEENVTV
ncbi:AAA family ATPase [Elizabethkingia anophelis]|uniref:AAA family ATPase n=1 Tax=Elizabethkingia anophelis TaxID=1117645 RepID=UPI00092A69E0|nr:AAA family ATPase [Elizabethkingia anophelis]MBN9312723.1 AAA family ATPase [Chryseobacterium sp.]OJV49363.1 MAG: anticodon nuclease [Chryseobacterium sp. 39-10]MBE9391968.1 AAA family ATPase [Elizabethkingia anophelis]MBE9405408.1 AAA family ATPase [Elizabethkingia anophelis]MDV3874217.1 anticodon nuclease [Elizabethkingia anophelis]